MGAVQREADRKTPNFVLLSITADQVARQVGRRSLGFEGGFTAVSAPKPPTIGVGDLLNVTIFEAAEGGLFTARMPGLGSSADRGSSVSAGSTSIPAQVVDPQGMIFVPYAGYVHVAGKTIPQVSETIVRSLRGVAVDPQVIVTVGESRSNAVTVLGGVARNGLMPLSPAGDRILDVLAQAGGTGINARDTAIRLVRGDQTFNVPLTVILERPEQNILLQPGDTLYVDVDRNTYSVLGGTIGQNEFPIDRDRLTLAEALGRANGINDNRANRRGLFIFRYEDAAYLRDLTDVSRFGDLDPIPVVYQLQLNEPVSYHLMQKFVVQTDDVIYVANAPTTELAKFLGILNSSVNSVATPLIVGATVSN